MVLFFKGVFVFDNIQLYLLCLCPDVMHCPLDWPVLVLTWAFASGGFGGAFYSTICRDLQV